MAITKEDRAAIRAFLDEVFERLNRKVFDDNVAKAAFENVITALTLGSKKKAFEYMQSVIKGQGD